MTILRPVLPPPPSAEPLIYNPFATITVKKLPPPPPFQANLYRRRPSRLEFLSNAIRLALAASLAGTQSNNAGDEGAFSPSCQPAKIEPEDASQPESGANSKSEDLERGTQKRS